MKKPTGLFFLILLFILKPIITKAQLPSGSIAPDFTVNDINGTPWHLYDLLDQGKSVVIEVSAAWCSPCWLYHSSGTLENLYNQYGPTGANELMVFFVEAESTNTTAQLYGNSSGTIGNHDTFSQGDWVTGTPFPFLDNTNIDSLYNVNYFPTIYVICPDRTIKAVGQLTTAALYAETGTCSYATAPNDAEIIGATSLNQFPLSCTGVNLNFLLANVGASILTSAEIRVNVAGSIQQSFNWSGNLASYSNAQLSFTGVTGVSGSNIATIEVANPNGLPDADTTNNKQDVVFTILPQTGGQPVIEDFTPVNFPPTNWLRFNGGDPNVSWSRSGAGLNGAGSAKMDFYNAPAGDVDELQLPGIDMTGGVNAMLSFDVAAATNGSTNDELQVQISTDCGITWNTVYSKAGSALATAGSVSGSFVPTSVQWLSEVVPLNNYLGNNNVIAKFSAISDNGNNCYVDNINFSLTTGIFTAVNEFEFSVNNPVFDYARVHLKLKTPQHVTLEIKDLCDKIVLVKQSTFTEGTYTALINMSPFSQGIYFLRITHKEGIIVKQLIKE